MTKLRNKGSDFNSEFTGYVPSGGVVDVDDQYVDFLRSEHSFGDADDDAEVTKPTREDTFSDVRTPNVTEHPAEPVTAENDFETLDGVGEITARRLRENNYLTFDDLATADPEEVAGQVNGLSADEFRKVQEQMAESDAEGHTVVDPLTDLEDLDDDSDED